jgi:hypothetical protein
MRAAAVVSIDWDNRAVMTDFVTEDDSTQPYEAAVRLLQERRIAEPNVDHFVVMSREECKVRTAKVTGK